MKKSSVWTVVKIVLAVVLAGFVLSKTSLSELAALRQRVSGPWLLAGVVSFAIVTLLMARRYWILLGREVEFPKLLNVVILQNAVSNFVASSAGAASYVAILRGEHQIGVSQGITSFLLAKVGDLLAIWLALALSGWAVWSQITTVRWLIVILFAGMAGGLIAFSLTLVLRQQFVSSLNWFIHKLHLNHFAFFARLLRILSSLADQELRSLLPLLCPVIGYSCLILACTFAWAYCNVRTFEVPIGIWPVVFMVSLTQMVAFVPVQVFGGLGVYDVTAIYLYGLFGLSQSEIAPVVISLRLILYLISLLSLVYLPLNAWVGRVEDRC